MILSGATHQKCSILGGGNIIWWWWDHLNIMKCFVLVAPKAPHIHCFVWFAQVYKGGSADRISSFYRWGIWGIGGWRDLMKSWGPLGILGASICQLWKEQDGWCHWRFSARTGDNVWVKFGTSHKWASDDCCSIETPQKAPGAQNKWL